MSMQHPFFGSNLNNLSGGSIYGKIETTHVEEIRIMRIPPHNLDVALDAPSRHLRRGGAHVRGHDGAVVTPTQQHRRRRRMPFNRAHLVRMVIVGFGALLRVQIPELDGLVGRGRGQQVPMGSIGR